MQLKNTIRHRSHKINIHFQSFHKQRKCKVRFRLDNTSNIQQEPTELSTYHVPIKLEKKFNSLFTYHLHTKDKCYSQKKMLSTKYFSHPSFIIMQDLVSLLICKHHKLTICVYCSYQNIHSEGPGKINH